MILTIEYNCNFIKYEKDRYPFIDMQGYFQSLQKLKKFILSWFMNKAISITRSLIYQNTYSVVILPVEFIKEVHNLQSLNTIINKHDNSY